MKPTIPIAILTFLIGLTLGLTLGLTINYPNPTGQVIEEPEHNYSYTRAICNQDQCIDVLVECQNGEVQTLTPLTNLTQIPNIQPNQEEFCN